MTCHINTEYTEHELNNMFNSSMFILNQLNDINNTEVISKDYKDNDINLFININDIVFSHNAMLIYTNRDIIKHLKEYLFTISKDAGYNIRFGGNGHGTALVCSY